jgi:hypothetical protein
MGCGGSSASSTKPQKNAQAETPKDACLIFGMPDSGQSAFAKSMERSFHTDSFTQSPYQFVPISSSRESRSSWLLEYENRPKVVCSFFFPDLTSASSVLFSVRTLNWMKSQLGKTPPPRVIGFIKNAKDVTNFELLKSYLEPDSDTMTYSDGNQADIQKCVEYVQRCAARPA